jgi:propanol-preferring alcohol dehydrogenase
MKAMVVQKWGEKSVLMNRPDPKPGPREAVMRVRAAGVGLTLLNMRNGSFGGEAPRIMGHELGGDIGLRPVTEECHLRFQACCATLGF